MTPTWGRVRRGVVVALLSMTTATVLGAPTARAAPSTTATVPATTAVAPAVTAATVTAPLHVVAQKALWATTQETSYLWGGGHGAQPATTPDRTDCSGFSRWAYWTALGYDIGGGSGESMRTSGRFTKVSSPQPGDTVFFGANGQPPATHMGIYIGTDRLGARLMANNSGSDSNADVRNLDTPRTKARTIGFYRLTAVAVPIRTKNTYLTIALSPVQVSIGQTSTIGGNLNADAGAVAGQHVYLDVLQPDGSWLFSVRSATTSSTGRYTFTVTGNGSRRVFQVHHTGRWTPWLSSDSLEVTQYARAS